jgi:hypothetical protein
MKEGKEKLELEHSKCPAYLTITEGESPNIPRARMFLKENSLPKL